MKIYFRKENSIHVHRYWLIDYVLFLSAGCYSAGSLNEEEFKMVLKYLDKHFESVNRYGCHKNYRSFHAEFFRFDFKNPADEAHFILLTHDGIEL